VTFALRKAIEQGVIEIILEGVDKGLWKLSQEKVVVLDVHSDMIEYIPVVETPDVHLDLSIESEDKTYEQYQEEKKLKKLGLWKIKKEIEEDALEKKQCTNIKIDQEGVESCIDEINWEKVDEEREKSITPEPKPETEEVKNENDNETVDTSTTTK